MGRGRAGFDRERIQEIGVIKMPTYGYQCNKCKYTFDVFQSITAPPIKSCPKCRGRVKRLISGGAAIIFKGSGFYKTDYRSESYKKGRDAERPKEKEKSDNKQKAQDKKER